MARKKKTLYNVTDVFTGKWRNQHTFISSNYNFRKNEITAETEFQIVRANKLIEDWKVLEDEHVLDIALDLSQNDLEYSVQKLNGFINTSLVSPRYNIVEDYLYSLPEWSGEKDYIAELAATVKTDDDEFFYDVLKRFLVGSVDCLLNNKSNDICLILQGSQGLGKTRWMKLLLPNHLREDLYHESPIDTKNKEHDELLSTKWFICLDELETMKSTEINALKAFVTKTQINHRKVHGHRKSKFPRRASFLGNVNQDEFLTDTTGSRRWLAFSASEIDYNHSIDIGKVYAQSLHLLQSGTFRHWFNRKEIISINERNEKFSIKSMEEEMFLQNFELLQHGQYGGEWLSSTEIIEKLVCFYPKTATRLDNKKIGSVCSKVIRIKGSDYKASKKRSSYSNKYHVRYVGPTELRIDGAMHERSAPLSVVNSTSQKDLPI